MSCVLVFGEDDNDRVALTHLVRGVARGSTKIRSLRKPIILSKDASANKRKTAAADIASFARGFEKIEGRVIVVAHRDCDDIEPAHESAAEVIETELRKAGVKIPIAATPAWEMETWWMLFPDVVSSLRDCWRPIDYGNKHVGRIENAKEQLTRDLRPVAASGRTKCPDFASADGPRVAEAIAARHDLKAPTKARSDSFRAFVQKLVDGLRA